MVHHMHNRRHHHHQGTKGTLHHKGMMGILNTLHRQGTAEGTVSTTTITTNNLVVTRVTSMMGTLHLRHPLNLILPPKFIIVNIPIIEMMVVSPFLRAVLLPSVAAVCWKNAASSGLALLGILPNYMPLLD